MPERCSQKPGTGACAFSSAVRFLLNANRGDAVVPGMTGFLPHSPVAEVGDVAGGRSICAAEIAIIVDGNPCIAEYPDGRNLITEIA